jgi:hypothetical protein
MFGREGAPSGDHPLDDRHTCAPDLSLKAEGEQTRNMAPILQQQHQRQQQQYRQSSLKRRKGTKQQRRRKNEDDCLFYAAVAVFALAAFFVPFAVTFFLFQTFRRQRHHKKYGSYEAEEREMTPVREIKRDSTEGNLLALTEAAYPRRTAANLPSILLTGVARDDVDGAHLRNQLPKMVRLAAALTNRFHVIVYENGSPSSAGGGGARNVLTELLADYRRGTLLVQDNVPESHARTRGIARARNTVLDYVETNRSDTLGRYDYLFVMDLDGVCGGSDPDLSYDPDVFQYALDHADRWDAVSFRFVPYWDLWAFRHPVWMPHSNQGWNAAENRIQNSDDMDAFLDSHSRGEFIPVESAFMMTAVYKMSAVRGARYGWTDEAGEMDCEHVSFHSDMVTKHNATIALLPLVYCQGDKGYAPLQEQLAMHPVPTKSKREKKDVKDSVWTDTTINPIVLFASITTLILFFGVLLMRRN